MTKDINSSQESPTLAYWHVYTDGQGVSKQQRVEITDFQKESMGGDAAEQWNKHLLDANAHIMFAEMPVGWVGQWHENPKPQWIVPLSGSWYVETMDGMRVEMSVGELSFGGDQNTIKDTQGHEGHISGTVGNQPVKLMIIQLIDDKWIAAKPGDLLKIEKMN
ncbi:MAG: hypothetical protein ABI295_07300 [Xanthomarina sp.]